MPPPYDNNPAEERTEAATQFRREEFRRKGNVAISRELISILLLTAGGCALFLATRSGVTEFTKMSESFFRFSRISPYEKSDIFLLGFQLFKSFMWMVLPLIGVTWIVGVGACVAQVGFHIATEPLSPNWDRLNPVVGFQRLFSSFGMIEAAKALVKVSVAFIVLWFFVRSEGEIVGRLFQGGVGEISVATMISLAKIFFSVIGALSFIALVDYAYQRIQFERSIRMTRREAKEEFKLREGDPLIKSRIRSIQRRIASRRMMENVPKSDVVVTNPTRLAVALRYDAAQMHAPKVVAKGAGFIAEKIKEVARFHLVPIVENKPLARTLYKELEVNDFIPKELYKAVAEVLAYVYRLKGVPEAKAVG